MSWIKKLIPAKITVGAVDKKKVPEGLWVKCSECNAYLFKNELERNLDVCPKCGHHLRISARKRIDQFLDKERRRELATNVEPVDILKFKDTKKYKDRLAAAQKKTAERDALIVFKGKLNGLDIIACAFEFGFIGGSMGTVVGQKFIMAVEACIADSLPLVCFAASGGARMQESLFSLMQMTKTSAALARLKQQKLPYISVMVDPCTGGVSASLAMLGDINLAEPKALIGFAGRRVIEQTVREKLPDDFQSSEFLLENGFIDMIVPRGEMRDTIHRLLTKLTNAH